MCKISKLLFLLTFCFIYGKETNRPRGVSLKDAPLYDEAEGKFQCLDGSKTIPFEAVNDDYCDCNDGSDEPGTSACPNGKFYCPNIGYASKIIPSSNVNDNICDCCDGSDEWDSQVTCPNICESLGAEAKEKAIKKLEVIKEGWEKKQELIKEGIKIYSEKSESIVQVKNELDKLKKEKEEVELEMKPFEEKERELKEKADKAWDEIVKAHKEKKGKKLFDILDINGDGKITLDEVKKRQEADSDDNKEISDEEAKIFLRDKEEADFETFINDIYDTVKYKMFNDLSKEKDNNNEESTKEEENNDNKDEETHDETELKEEDDIGEKPEYNEETKAAIDVVDKFREKVREISDKIFNMEESIRDDEKFLEMDFGEDKSWASLYKKCFEITQKQYVYKVCLFEKTTQKDSNGYGETSLGNWDNWVDKEENSYKTQNYNNGQSCWNGPNRSTKITVQCGAETELVEASEPSKCEYLFTLKSPVACPDPSTINIHDEL
uniref:Glucosidase 2 subunit beta n=1 Tax=Parastrongyloides trichosuri TaxID=131310 RepID=A0A0N4ZNG2_PARTI